jgi:hypothetical protein
VGKIALSAAPTTARAISNDPNDEVVAIGVKMVAKLHMTRPALIMIRGDWDPAMSPQGIMASPYPTEKREEMDPLTVSEKPNSCDKGSMATDIATRSSAERKAVPQRSPVMMKTMLPSSVTELCILASEGVVSLDERETTEVRLREEL